MTEEINSADHAEAAEYFNAMTRWARRYNEAAEERERFRAALRAIADLPYDAIHRNQDPRLIASRALEGKQ